MAAMKTPAIAAFLSLVAAVAAAADSWTYDPSAGTVSDGEWTFNASASGSSLTVKAVTGWPETVSRLDFSKPVSDAGGNSYTIVTLNPGFARKKESATDDGYRPGDLEAADASPMLGELVLPQTGLTTISRAAFAYCSNLTNIVNYLPDSVTTIGNSAFAYCPARQDLFIRGLSGGTGRGIFYHASIKSITFGPGFKTIGDTGNSNGSFQGCSSITNLVFSPESSGITLPANAFRCKPTLTQPLVLYGVKSVASTAFSEWKIPSITFDKCIESIGALTGVTTLREVHFLGGPPSSETGKFADYGQGTSAEVTTYVRRKFGKEWLPYSAGGDINMKNTTFSSEYATDPTKRKLLFVDKLPGFYIQFK